MDSTSPEFKLSYNFAVLKAVAAILQILFATYNYGLYEAGKGQIEYYGYASYIFTVVPYAFMSVINLIAALCSPEFPTMYLLRYEPKSNWDCDNEVIDFINSRIQGPVGFFHFTDNAPRTTADTGHININIEATPLDTPSADYSGLDETKRRKIRVNVGWLLLLLSRTLFILPPILIIYFFTYFEKKQSTPTQRGWLIAWQVVGSVVSIWSSNLHVEKVALYLKYFYSQGWKFWSAPWPNQIIFVRIVQDFMWLGLAIVVGIGGYVTVIQMIQGFGVCTVV